MCAVSHMFGPSSFDLQGLMYYEIYYEIVKTLLPTQLLHRV